MVSFNNCGNDPVSRASEVVSTLAYLRGDVAPSRHTVELRVTERELFDRGRGYAENFSPVLGKIFPLCRIGLKYEGSTPQPAGAEYVPDLIIGAEEIILPGGRRIPRDSRNPGPARPSPVMRETGILPRGKPDRHGPAHLRERHRRNSHEFGGERLCADHAAAGGGAGPGNAAGTGG